VHTNVFAALTLLFATHNSVPKGRLKMPQDAILGYLYL